MRTARRIIVQTLLIAAVPVIAAGKTTTPAAGQPVYESSCAACHATGAAGAPRFGDARAWAPRLRRGMAALYDSAWNGKNAMPPRGGNAALTLAEVRAAVDYMAAAAKSPPKDARTDTAADPTDARTAVEAPPPAFPADSVNAFNRLMKPTPKANRPPAEDDIHDPDHEDTHLLQPPTLAFSALPRSQAGNRVDWVKALNTGKIQPRHDRVNPKSKAMVFDLNIVREVKGSMPDVVYPHKPHTEWLDCSNCHPALFKPQKGANPMSMASIMLGQQCGVCHGKVAFPVSECRLCHSKKK